jgi:hypothetical protein
MKAIDQPNTTPTTAIETKQEDRFEKELVDRDSKSSYHLNNFNRIFLGGLLIFGLILFYVVHISREGHLGTYGGNPVPVVDTQAAKP